MFDTVWQFQMWASGFLIGFLVAGIMVVLIYEYSGRGDTLRNREHRPLPDRE